MNIVCKVNTFFSLFHPHKHVFIYFSSIIMSYLTFNATFQTALAEKEKGEIPTNEHSPLTNSIIMT